MFLEKLEVQGFKSFANKNKLIFSGILEGEKRGLTAIVGPNGSGKSNVADAVRWALGEQSLKTLRGKKSEDVIFSGSDQKQRLGLAEVSLYLNNSDLKDKPTTPPESVEKEADLDQMILSCPEIVITRRLYRSGESEYLLNGSRVRLSDIQMLLAKANFGQKTYSVIGQGMVENFLTTSAAERKDFFDEATGVKQFQIKRDSSLNKLESSYTNLQQVDMLLSEIRPRLKSLTRSVEKLQRREQIELDLSAKQHRYYGHLWQESTKKLAEKNSLFLTKEKVKREREKALEKLNGELEKIRLNDNRPKMDQIQAQIQTLSSQKDQFLKQIARLQAEGAIQLEAQGKFDISWLNTKQEELGAQLKLAEKDLETFSAASDNEELQRREQELRGVQNKLAELNTELTNLNRNISQLEGAEDQNKKLSRLIEAFIIRLDEVSLLNDLEKIKETIAVIKQDWQRETRNLSGDDWRRIKEIQSEIMALTEKRQLAGDRLNEERLRLAGINERKRFATEKVDNLRNEIKIITEKLSRNTGSIDEAQLAKAKEEAQALLTNVEEKIADLEKARESLNRDREKEKSLMYRCQQEIQAEQELINEINRELSSIQIESAREETRLEDLEANLRRDGLALTEISNFQNAEPEINIDQLQREIANAKNQLDQIGGIDPETEKEYHETKERYDFLSAQVNDLNNTIESLEEIISELDKNIKVRFDTEFKVISEKFNEYFKILFNGGTAKIGKVLADEKDKEDTKNNSDNAKPLAGLTTAENEIKDEADARLKRIRSLKKSSAAGLVGIDIQATPPGKKIQSVTMLSGGERALTAIALICAIISANPAPFVVLDEVDAALDEANSQRLAKILDDLSGRTQFIVITHNRACMRQASILYGVTMESDGVSKLLSIKLDDIKG